MGGSQLHLPILLVTLTSLTVTEAQYYDVFQGIQQLFQPYPQPNYFPQYAAPRQPNTQRLPSQESKKKIDEIRRNPVHQYEYVFSTTPKSIKAKPSTKPSSHKQVNSYTFSNLFTPEVTTKRNRVSTNRAKATTAKPKTTTPFNRDAIIFRDSKETHENLGFKRVTNSRNPNVQHIDINPDFVKPTNTRNPDVQAVSTPKKTGIGSAISGIRRVTNAYNTNRGSFNTDLDGTPMINSPGVRPAPVDVNQPPITNRPVEKNNFVPYDRPDDYGSEKTSDTPEILTGPDEDDMTERQKRRYIDLAEKMCDRYKSLSVKEVVALPLLPSPDPAEAVELNVSSCTPITVPLVIGGRIASINEFPHMALVGWRKIRSTGYSWKCGGSLISERYVLTAGHCTYQDKDYDVESGPPQAVQLGSSILDDPNAQVVKISAVIRHPKYKQRRSYYDIALIKLTRTVKFTDVIRPACLGVPPSVGESIIATGWGRTEFGGDHSRDLRSVSLPVWDMTECREVWGTSLKLPNGPLPDSHVCAAEKKGGKDTCQGDSGGPAQIQDGCVWRVVAVTSYGRSCGAPNTPALYAVTKPVFIAAQIFGDSDDRQDREADRKPSYSSRPSVSDRNPSYSDRNPSYSDRNPSYSGRPSYAEKQPSYSNTKPSYSDRNPSYSDRNPSYLDRNPTYSDRNPYNSDTKPSYSDRNPSYSDRNPSYSQRQPSYSSIPSFSEREPPYFERQPSYSPSYSDIQPDYFDSSQGFVNTRPYFVNNFRRQ